jgi:two-component system cell cycle response regulator
MEELERELERAHRTDGFLSLAFVDIDGLKAVNDDEGHLAGDALLQVTGQALRASLRAYDLIIRYGGDEFVCAMSNMDESVARQRFEQVTAKLAERHPGHTITYGLTEAERTDTVETLIKRADAELLSARRLRKT